MLSIVHLLHLCAILTKTNLFNLDYLILKSIYQTYTFSIRVWKISDEFKDHLTLACDTKLRMMVFSAEYSIHIKNKVKDKVMKVFLRSVSSKKGFWQSSSANERLMLVDESKKSPNSLSVYWQRECQHSIGKKKKAYMLDIELSNLTHPHQRTQNVRERTKKRHWLAMRWGRKKNNTGYCLREEKTK